MIDIHKLISWLGVHGAIYGLDKSDITNSELVDLFKKYLPKGVGKMKRYDIIEYVVMEARKEGQKTVDELMCLPKDELMKYFIEQKYTRSEILNLLLSLEIKPGSSSKKNLMDFAVNEISEIGMFRRVAKGNHENYA